MTTSWIGSRQLSVASSLRCALRSSGAALLLLAACAPVASAEGDESLLAQESLAICRAADHEPVAARLASLDQGLALAERAVAAEPDDPVAHFAAFCNLGKRVQLAGLSAGLLGDVRRVRRHIDLAVELAPDWPEALVGKGALLLALPGFLGGAKGEGERLLRRAIELDPGNEEARAFLAAAE